MTGRRMRRWSGLTTGLGIVLWITASIVGSSALVAARSASLDPAPLSVSRSPLHGTAPAGIRVDRMSPNRGTAAGGTPLAVFGEGLDRVMFITAGRVSVTCVPLPTSIAPTGSPGDVFASYERAAYESSQRAAAFTHRRAAVPQASTAGACFASIRELYVLTPAHAPGTVSFSVLGRTFPFTYTTAPPPQVDAISPGSGSAVGGATGDVINVYGSGFTGATGATFDGGAHTSFVIVGTDNYLGIIGGFPPGIANTTVDVQVITPAGMSTVNPADKFTYTNPPVPVVTAIDPRGGPAPGGTSVTIYGSGFLGATQANFGGVAVSLPLFAVASQSQITVASPAGAIGQVDITVVTPGGTSATSLADRFTYAAAVAPVITTIAPAFGLTGGGTTVYISGNGFLGTSSVSFGANLAPPVSVLTDDLIQATSPAGTGSVHITVTTTAGPVTSAATFTYTSSPPPSAPEVDALSVHSGNARGGVIVGIFGRGFTGATSIRFGSTPVGWVCFFGCDVGLTTDFGTPAGPAGSTVDVTVTTPAGTSATSAADHFTYLALPPVVAALVPSHGPASAPIDVTIEGSGLTGGTTAHFGTVPATYYPSLFDAQAAALSPAGSGTVDVTVTSSVATSATSSADLYTYDPEPTLAVTALGPSSGPAAGGTDVYITGAGFGGATSVTFGSTSAASFQAFGDGLIKTTSPPGFGKVDVHVTTPAGTSPSVPADVFAYLGPPSAPLAVSAAAGPGTGTATVIWSAPAWNGGNTITSYTVKCSPLCAPVVVSGSTFTVTISGLNGLYTFTVTATNANGPGPPSSATARISIRGAASQSSPTPAPRTPVTQSSGAPTPPPR